MPDMTPPPPGMYQHYKGRIYKVLGYGLHTETKEQMVVYHNPDKPNEIFLRPVSVWNTPTAKGGMRFVRLHEAP